MFFFYLLVKKTTSQLAKIQIFVNVKDVAKHPESILSKAAPDTYIYFLDYMDYFEESLFDIYDVVEACNQGIGPWILKPSRLNRANGLTIFKTIPELHEFLEAENAKDDYVENIREFVIQKYINNPLLLPEHKNRKFHFRVYVLCCGAIQTFVFDSILALFSALPYDSVDHKNLAAQLTNTCFQKVQKIKTTEEDDEEDGEEEEEGKKEIKTEENPANNEISEELEKELVLLIDELALPKERIADIFNQICLIMKDTFAAASRELDYRPLANAYELYGVDFLVDDEYEVKLLELNPHPDVKQTGGRLSSVVQTFLSDSMKIANDIFPIFPTEKKDGSDKMKVYPNFEETIKEIPWKSEDRLQGNGGKMHLVFQQK